MSNEYPPQSNPYGQPGTAASYGTPAAYAPAPDIASYPDVPMPISVRAARVTVFVTMGLCLLMSVVVGAANGPRAAGATFGQNLMGCVLFILAFRYHRAGNGLRVTSIVLASVQIALALGGTARGIQGGIFAMAGAITIIVLLSQRTAHEWFKRPRTPGMTYGPGSTVR